MSPQPHHAGPAIARQTWELDQIQWQVLPPGRSTNVVRLAWVRSGQRGATRTQEAKSTNGKFVGTLFVEFQGGRLYAYEDVPEGVLEDALKAKSIGKFVHQTIKADYAFTPVRTFVPGHQGDQPPPADPNPPDPPDQPAHPAKGV